MDGAPGPQLHRVRPSQEWFRDLDFQVHLLIYVFRQEFAGISMNQDWEPFGILQIIQRSEGWDDRRGQDCLESCGSKTKKTEMLDPQLPI